MDSSDFGTSRQTQTCRGRFSFTASCWAWISAQLSKTQRGNTTKHVANGDNTSQIIAGSLYKCLPCTLWSLDIQYRTPSVPCFIFSVSDIKRRRFLLNFISLFSVLCCFTRSCSQPPAMGANFCCLTSGSLAADVALRFLSDMMVWLANELVGQENTEVGFWFRWATSFKNDRGAQEKDELQVNHNEIGGKLNRNQTLRNKKYVVC